MIKGLKRDANAQIEKKDERRKNRKQEEKSGSTHLIDKGASSTDPVQALVLHVAGAPCRAVESNAIATYLTSFL